ncbi:hypothetical protein V2S66_03355 [Streptomyces sp. V4-01]|uniref:Secreted protein n=1 Tax=Actinacidiphila polyblastidii TaxID=3110430 RepID=A0ABU7P5D1_9ACTN|nr:hypothetical protein [Streptomyces sp. V4-01]
MDSPTTWLGVVAAAIATGGGVATAWLARGRQQEVPMAVPDPAPELVDADLSTLAGIAQVVSRQSMKISALERRAAAEARYRRRLAAALREEGLPVPDPDPEDAPLLRG